MKVYYMKSSQSAHFITNMKIKIIPIYNTMKSRVISTSTHQPLDNKDSKKNNHLIFDKNWESFCEKGVLKHHQSGIEIKIFPLHPSKRNAAEFDKFLKMLNQVDPDIVAIQMSEKVLLPNPKIEELYIPLRERQPQGPYLQVKDSFREAMEEATRGRSFMQDSFLDKIIAETHSRNKTVKFIDIPFLELESPSNTQYHELIKTARRRFRLEHPKYSSSWVGHLFYQFTLNRAFPKKEGMSIQDRIKQDKANVDDTFHFYNLFRAFHPPSFHRYFELPCAVMTEKLRSLVKGLYYSQYFHQDDDSNPSRSSANPTQTESPITSITTENVNESLKLSSSSFSSYSDTHSNASTSMNTNSMTKPPSILLIVGKPYMFPILQFWQTYIQAERFHDSISSFHQKSSHLLLQDSILMNVYNNNQSSSSKALSFEQQDELNDDVDDLIEAVVLQASTPLVRFTRPVENHDVVLDHKPRALPIQKKRDKDGFLTQHSTHDQQVGKNGKDEGHPKKLNDPKRTAFGFRYLE